MRHINLPVHKVTGIPVSTRWRYLPAPALDDLIQTIRRRAGAGHHLSQADWHQLDLMRRRLARLNEARS
jgi:hypothetical protein